MELLLNKSDATNVVLILDEADNMFSNSSGDMMNDREKVMYRILGNGVHSNHEVEDMPKPLENSRIRSFVQISATHLSTLVWHTIVDLKFKAVIATTHRLSEAGYMLPTDFEPVDFFTQEEVKHLNKGMQSKKVGRIQIYYWANTNGRQRGLASANRSRTDCSA